MPMSYLIPAGMSLLGGLMGSKEKTTGEVKPTSQTTVSSGSHGSTTQNSIDPRMEQAIYGAGGIMPNVAAWYQQNQSGLNDKMITGMNNQWNQLGASKQGFDQMQNLGMGLMGGGVAGNPFTGGGGIAPGQMSFKPAEMNMSGGANSPFSMSAPMAAPAMLPAYQGGGGGGGGGGGDEPQAAAPAAPADESNGYWFTDEGGDKFWQKGGGYAPSQGGYGKQPWSPAPTYQFNNGYAAYGADGSSAENPKGGGQ